jgi:hypothetical protein
VIEAGGSEDVRGTPRAFIETAWRSYTKHARNKAQEIQGAILPLAETYSSHHPFLGAVLAGRFTAGSLAQLRSHGFHLVSFSHETVMGLFRTVGIDAVWEENTPDSEIQTKVEAYDALTESEKENLVRAFQEVNRPELDRFLHDLRSVLLRQVELVFVLPLHGMRQELRSLDEAIHYLDSYRETRRAFGFLRYELNVRYSNGDEIRGTFEDKSAAVEFLRRLG